VVQEELHMVGAADAPAHLDAHLGVALAEPVHDAGDEVAVVALALGGVHVHQHQPVAALVEDEVQELDRFPGALAAPEHGDRQSVLEVQGG